MLTPIEQIEYKQQHWRTREQAAALLEALRAQYQELPQLERGAIKARFARLAAVHLSKEGEE